MFVKKVLAGAVVAAAIAVAVSFFGQPFGDTLSARPANAVTPESGLSSTVAPPLPCSVIFADRFPVDAEGADVTCTDDAGAVRELTGNACRDGRYLWTPPATSGAPLGWGFARETFHAVTGDLAADRGYQQAVKDCLT